jgi:MFS family permease
LIVALVVVVIGAAATLFGWDISGWLKHLWHEVTAISIGYLLAGIVLISLQTTTTAYAWYSILRFGYPASEVRWVQILACYAVAVALNSVLPANLGTLAMLLMFTTIIAAVNFAGVLGAIGVQKIFYTLIGAFVYLYLFLTIGGSFNLQLGFISAHPLATVILVAGVAALIYLVARILRERIREWWGEAKVGGPDPHAPARDDRLGHPVRDRAADPRLRLVGRQDVGLPVIRPGAREERRAVGRAQGQTAGQAGDEAPPRRRGRRRRRVDGRPLSRLGRRDP